MTAIEFYNLTKDTLDELAKERGVSDLNKYYELTDYESISLVKNLSGKEQIFAQMAFHAQNNGGTLPNIVKFEENSDFLKEALCGFNPNDFLIKFKQNNIEGSIKKIVDALRYDEATGKGLKWKKKEKAKSSENQKKNTRLPDIEGYAKTLIYCAEFIEKFDNKEAFLQNLKDQYQGEEGYKKLIEYFLKEIRYGFGVALTCDFLKEFDEEFNALPKPDRHIMSVMCAYKNHSDGYYDKNNTRKMECIADMQELVKNINAELNANITVYQLDRMIWLICSENFFLDHKKYWKAKYISMLHTHGRAPEA